MNNSSTGPLPSERASSEGDFSDFGRCDINEAGECDYGDVDHDQHYLEMFRRALKQRNQAAQRWLEHHFSAMLIDWIQAHPDDAQKKLIAELKEETKTEFAPDAVAQAWKRIRFTTDVPINLVAKAVQDGKDAGFLKGSTDTSKLIENP